ncbi:MAG: hypothetical protein KDK89_10250 [Alphaproteobacteria bacterium]|nr:hypothetical protein [Alphaproteobacteria bacterium]
MTIESSDAVGPRPTLPESGVVALESVLSRLEAVVEEENRILCEQRICSHREIMEQKHQLMRDLLNARRICGSSDVLQRAAGKWEKLKPTLERNERLLKSHLDALAHVAGIIVDCINQAESDGTYSRGLVSTVRKY